MALTDPLVVYPYWLERQIDPGSPDFLPGSAAEPVNRTHRRITTIGVLDRPERGAVDPCGLVVPEHAGWALDWWIGAEDRWHVPGRSPTIRQRLLGGPVVETAMRVPGGDVLHRAGGFLSSELGPCLVVEIENRTPVPVAVALAVRPYHPLGLTEVRAIVLDGDVVWVDERPALILPRPPAEARFGDHAGDVAGLLLAGATAPEGTGVSVADAGGRATAAFTFPLAHSLVLRAVVPLVTPGRARRRPGSAGIALDAVPAAEQVAKGWEAQIRRAMTVEVPDARWQAAAEAAVAHLLLAHGGEDVTVWPAGPPLELDDVAAVLGALGQWGFDDEVAEVLGSWPERQSLDGAFASYERRADAAGAALGAVAAHWALTGDAEIVERLVGPLAKAIHWIAKRRGSRRASRDPRALGLLPEGGAPDGGGEPGTYLRDSAVTITALTTVADALEAVGQPEVAADARRLAATLSADLGATIDAVAPGGAPLPPTPSRTAADPGIVVNLDLLAPFGPLRPDHPSAAATLDAIRALPTGGPPAIAQLRGPAGLGPARTAQCAVIEIDGGDPRAVDRLDWLIGAGGPTMVWPGALHPRTGDGAWGRPHDPVATARFLTALRRLLVRELTDGSGLALCSVIPPGWLGQSLDVRRAPTAFGRFSYSVRWHGERPAILWELDPHPSVDSLHLTAPGLDRQWSATGFEGEALLGPVAPPMAPPGTAEVEPAADDRGGGSFS
jgi:hypothetical protein